MRPQYDGKAQVANLVGIILLFSATCNLAVAKIDFAQQAETQQDKEQTTVETNNNNTSSSSSTAPVVTNDEKLIIKPYRISHNRLFANSLEYYFQGNSQQSQSIVLDHPSYNWNYSTVTLYMKRTLNQPTMQLPKYIKFVGTPPVIPLSQGMDIMLRVQRSDITKFAVNELIEPQFILRNNSCNKLSDSLNDGCFLLNKMTQDDCTWVLKTQREEEYQTSYQHNMKMILSLDLSMLRNNQSCVKVVRLFNQQEEILFSQCGIDDDGANQPDMEQTAKGINVQEQPTIVLLNKTFNHYVQVTKDKSVPSMSLNFNYTTAEADIKFKMYKPELILDHNRAKLYWLDFAQLDQTKQHSIKRFFEYSTNTDNSKYGESYPIELKFSFPSGLLQPQHQLSSKINYIDVKREGFISIGQAGLISPLSKKYHIRTNSHSKIQYYNDADFITIQYENVSLRRNRYSWDEPGGGDLSYQVTLAKTGDIAFVYKYLTSSTYKLLRPVKTNKEHMTTRRTCPSVYCSDDYINPDCYRQQIDRGISFEENSRDVHKSVNFENLRFEIRNDTAIILHRVCGGLTTKEACSQDQTQSGCVWCPETGKCVQIFDKRANILDTTICQTPEIFSRPSVYYLY